MQQTGKRQFILQKAYEISYAVFRVGSRISNAALKEHLERQALALLDAATVENYAWISTVSRAIEYLIKFGNDIGLINETNAEVIISQLNSMNVGVSGTEKSATAEEIPLDDIFSGHEPLFVQKPSRIEHAAEHMEESNVISSGMRQSAILQRIRQSGNCRLKEIQELFPEISERTLRYDLQSLAEQNLIERVGNGGPAVFYRVRQSV
jgi:hypothetical protein